MPVWPTPVVRRCPTANRSTTVRVVRGQPLLGTDLTGDDLPRLLDPIGYTVTGDGETRTVSLPTWRPDSEIEVDVIEEVARHYGYDNLGKAVPKSTVHGSAHGAPATTAVAARGAARPGDLRSDAEPVPCARHPGRGGPRRPVDLDHQPTGRRGERAADLTPPGHAGSRRVQRVAPSPRGQAVRDRSRLPAGHRRVTRRVRSLVRRARRGGRHIGDGRVARGVGGTGRGRTDRPGSRSRRPARAHARRCCRPARSRPARSARSTPVSRNGSMCRNGWRSWN